MSFGVNVGSGINPLIQWYYTTLTVPTAVIQTGTEIVPRSTPVWLTTAPLLPTADEKYPALPTRE